MGKSVPDPRVYDVRYSDHGEKMLLWKKERREKLY